MNANKSVVYWSSCVHQRSSRSIFQSLLQRRPARHVLPQPCSRSPCCYRGKPDDGYCHLSSMCLIPPDLIFSHRPVTTDLLIAFVADYQALLFSPSQAGSHLQNIPWTNLHTLGQLAPDGWNNRCDGGLQQCTSLHLTHSGN